MFVGLKSPLQASVQGTAMLVSGSDLVKQLVLTALRDCSSLNPFQDLGISDRNIFDINDEPTVARVRLRIQQIFAVFQIQELASLVKGEQSIVFSRQEEGALSAQIKYLDLETDKPDEISLSNDGTGWR